MANSRTRPRQPAPSRSTWVGPLAIYVLLGFTAVAAAGVGPDRSTPEKVLGCFVSEEVPSPAATAADGGFTFLYQSLGGVAEDGRACTVYRLKNEAGGPPTPVRWLAGEAVLVDLVQLRRCRDADGCPWFEIASYFDGGFHGGSTRLSFGLNADSFHQDGEGLIVETSPNLGETAASVGTEVVGVLTLADEQRVELDLIVKSRFERRGGTINLVYEVVSKNPEMLSGERVALLWSAAFAGEAAVQLRADEALPFMQLPSGSPLAGERLSYTARRGSEVVAVVVEVTDFEYLPNSVLHFVEPSDPTKFLLSVPLPTFVPADP